MKIKAVIEDDDDPYQTKPVTNEGRDCDQGKRLSTGGSGETPEQI